ncbi:MAG: MerR family transcriptional regulator [Solirubrobacteraceae bacterium]
MAAKTFRNDRFTALHLVRHLKTSEAAALLGVSPNTLRAWERRFGFPQPQRSPGRHRMFTHGEVAALRDALQDGLSISSAVSRAREGLSGDAGSLVGALISFERERADAILEATLALRSLERSVQEVVLPTLDEVVERSGPDSASWAFAARWAGDWLRRARRLAPPPNRPGWVLIGEATGDELDPDAPYVRALELFLARAGLDVLGLPARAVAGLGDLVAARPPTVAILAGARLDDDGVARWVYALRPAGPIAMAVYRRRDRRGGRMPELPVDPAGAQQRVLELMTAEPAHLAVAVGRAGSD